LEMAYPTTVSLLELDHDAHGLIAAVGEHPVRLRGVGDLEAMGDEVADIDLPACDELEKQLALTLMVPVGQHGSFALVSADEREVFAHEIAGHVLLLGRAGVSG